MIATSGLPSLLKSPTTACTAPRPAGSGTLPTLLNDSSPLLIMKVTLACRGFAEFGQGGVVRAVQTGTRVMRSALPSPLMSAVRAAVSGGRLGREYSGKAPLPSPTRNP